MYPLSLTAHFQGWRIFTARKADPAFRRFSERVWERDAYTCQFCGFQANAYQEVVNLNQNYTDNRLANLVTACCFCAQCSFIESVGISDFGGGTIIYLPHISQGQLNAACHVLFCAIAQKTAYAMCAENILRALRLRAREVEQRFGEGTSDPATLGRLVQASVGAMADKVKIGLDSLRLLPARARFKTQIEHWAVGVVETFD